MNEPKSMGIFTLYEIWEGFCSRSPFISENLFSINILQSFCFASESLEIFPKTDLTKVAGLALHKHPIELDPVDFPHSPRIGMDI
jgi:hypothetical protein